MKRLDHGLLAITLFFIRYPRFVLAVMALLAVLVFQQARHLQFDASAEGFLAQDDPMRLAYLEFEEQYGLSAYFIILIRDPGLFGEAQAARIMAMENAILETIPHVDSVESLASATFIGSEGDDIQIDRFLPEDLAGTDFVAKKSAAVSNPYFLNRLVNPAGDATAIIVKLSRYAGDAGQGTLHRMYVDDVMQTLDGLRQLLAQYQPHFALPILVGGSPTIAAELTRTTKREMLVFSLLSMAIVAMVLFLQFRRLTAILFPLLCLVLCIGITLALMVAGRYPVQVTGSILPSFLLAVCVGDAVHFLTAYYRQIAVTGDAGRADRQAAIAHAMQHSGLAMFFTTLTTSLGLLSFSTSSIAPVASFGLFSAIGVWLAFLLTIVCLPCLLVLVPGGRAARLSRLSLPAGWALRLISLVTARARAVVAIALVLLLAALSVAAQLSFSYNPLKWFEPGNPVRVANAVIEEELAGTMQAELLVSSRQAGQPLTLAHLQAIDAWLEGLSGQPVEGIGIRSHNSVLQLLKEANAVLSDDRRYALADSPELLAQQLLLLEFDAGNTLDRLMSAGRDEMRITVSIPWQDSLAYTRFVAAIEAGFAASLGQELQLEVTGMATLGNRAFADMIHAMGSSYVLAMAVISVVMALLFQSLRLGVLMTLPNLLPIMLVMAVMYLAGIPLDLFTLLIGSIAIGLVVDDTIHFVHTFRQRMALHDDCRQALVETVESTGLAMFTTTLVLCLGFMVYAVSTLGNLQAFGFLTALTLFFALLADLIIAPAMLFLLYNNNHADHCQ